jgi:DnaJ-class molecular chaperone
MRVRDKGIQSSNGKKSGALLVTVDVQVPAELNEEQRAAVDALAEVFDPDPRAALFPPVGDHKETVE